MPKNVFTLEGDKGAVDFLKLAPPARDDLSRKLERMMVMTPETGPRGLLEKESRESLASVQAEADQRRCLASARRRGFQGAGRASS